MKLLSVANITTCNLHRIIWRSNKIWTEASKWIIKMARIIPRLLIDLWSASMLSWSILHIKWKNKNQRWLSSFLTALLINSKRMKMTRRSLPQQPPPIQWLPQQLILLLKKDKVQEKEKTRQTKGFATNSAKCSEVVKRDNLNSN